MLTTGREHKRKTEVKIKLKNDADTEGTKGERNLPIEY